MARIYSHSESRAKGSVGLTTYRTVRGRVIQSQKIAPWDPAIDKVGGATRWNERTALLGLISLWQSNHAQSIKNSFNRTKNGSQRNYFMKRNYAALRMALNELAIEYAATKVAPDMTAIEDAIGAYAALHPMTIYRVKKTGHDIVFLANNWDDANDPAPPAVIDSMTYSLDTDYQLTQVVMTGSNLSQSIKMRLAGAILDGSMVISMGDKRAVFTPSTPVIILGDKELAALIGSVVKKSIIVSGDQRDYYNLSLLVAPSGGGQVTGAGRYPVGTNVPVSAVPSLGYQFIKWSDGNINPNRSIDISEDLTLTAQFNKISTEVVINFEPGVVTNIRVGETNYPVAGDDEYAQMSIEKGTNKEIELTIASGTTFSYMEISRYLGDGTGFGSDPEDLSASTQNNPATLYVGQAQPDNLEIQVFFE